MIECRILDNGVKCYVVQKKGFVEKEAMIVFNYGSCDTHYKVDEKMIRQPSGIAHFLEHKMFELKDRNIFDDFTKYGAYSNAFTNFSSTAYYFNCSDNFKENLSLLYEMVGNLYLTDENIQKEKGIINQEINMYEDDPYWQVYFNTLKCCYKNNAVRDSVAGSVESVSEITQDMLYKSYESFYTYDNCTVIVVGDVDFESVCEQTEKELQLNPICNLEKLKHYETGVYTKKLTKSMPVQKTIYNIGFKENNIIDNIAKRFCIGNVILKLLTDKSSSLWYTLYKSGLVDYGFGYDYVVGCDYGCSIIKGEGNEYKKICSEVQDEINRFVNFGISNDFIERITNTLKSRILMSFDSISSIAAMLADCTSKNIEILDIYKNYDKINSNDIIYALKNNFTDYVVSLIEPI